MKIINFKLNIFKIVIFICAIVAIVLLIFSIKHFQNLVANSNEYIIMNNENYTTVLKDCHDNLKGFIGKKIKANGYVFRADDFNDKQFVVARDMIVSYPDDARIVGFLCEYDNAFEYEDNIWVEISGVIKKGNYYGEIPIIYIEEIRRITTPNEIFVYPPKGFFEELDKEMLSSNYAIWE